MADEYIAPRSESSGFNSIIAKFRSWGWLLARAFTGVALANMGWNKILAWPVDFVNSSTHFGVEPAITCSWAAALLSMTIEFFAGAAITLGVWTRPFAVAATIDTTLLMITGRSFDSDLSLVWLGCLVLSVVGAGPYSIENIGKTLAHTGKFWRL